MTNEERRTTLTDEERRKLVADLNVVPWEIYRNALLEIERLEKEVETLKAQQREVIPPFYF
jgi:uncharacterized protein (UPF0335 family)